jgi:hypothetical protein
LSSKDKWLKVICCSIHPFPCNKIKHRLAEPARNNQEKHFVAVLIDLTNYHVL